MKIKHILVAMADPAARSSMALAKAAALARKTDAELTLFHSLYSPYVAGEQFYSPDALEKDIEGAVNARKAQLARVALALGKDGLRGAGAGSLGLPGLREHRARGRPRGRRPRRGRESSSHARSEGGVVQHGLAADQAVPLPGPVRQDDEALRPRAGPGSGRSTARPRQAGGARQDDPGARQRTGRTLQWTAACGRIPTCWPRRSPRAC